MPSIISHDADTHSTSGPAEVCLEHLTDVHPRWNTERVEDDVDRRSVLEGRNGMSFDNHDLGDHALVTVTTSHLVADLKLPLDRDVDLDQLDDAGGARRPSCALNLSGPSARGFGPPFRDPCPRGSMTFASRPHHPRW